MALAFPTGRWQTGAGGLLLFLAATRLPAAEPPSIPTPPPSVTRAPEYALRAAYLYNFALFVEWPEEQQKQNGPLLICVLGDDPFGSVLPDTLRGKRAGGRELRAAVATTREELAPCSVVYVPAADTQAQRALLEPLSGQPVLTVGEPDDFLDRGGIIRLFLEGDKLRFEVSADAARRSRLKLSSRLLELARAHRKAPGGGT